MYRYSWLITFEIFQIFFFLDRGVGGWGQLYPNFFWIFGFFLYLQGPLGQYMPKIICICILLIYFKVISKKGVTIAPAYPTVGQNAK